MGKHGKHGKLWTNNGKVWWKHRASIDKHGTNIGLAWGNLMQWASIGQGSGKSWPSIDQIYSAQSYLMTNIKNYGYKANQANFNTLRKTSTFSEIKDLEFHSHSKSPSLTIVHNVYNI